MILTGDEIKKLIEEKNLIENYTTDSIRSASYDVAIESTILEMKIQNTIIDLSNANQIDSLYQSIDISNGYILTPQKCILVTLKETIHMPENLCAHIRPRTSLSRLGLLLPMQHINSGYSGKLSLLLSNVSPNSYRIYPDLKIGQIVFELLNNNVSENLLYFNEKTPVYQNEKGNLGSRIYADYIGKVFRHFKGNYYFIEDITLNTETKETMILYKALYHNQESQLWVRPATMFFEEIDPNRKDNVTGQNHRFELVNDLSKDFTKK